MVDSWDAYSAYCSMTPPTVKGSFDFRANSEMEENGDEVGCFAMLERVTY